MQLCSFAALEPRPFYMREKYICISTVHNHVCALLQDFVTGHNGQRTFAWHKPVDLHPSAAKSSPKLEVCALIVAEKAAVKQTYQA